MVKKIAAITGSIAMGFWCGMILSDSIWKNKYATLNKEWKEQCDGLNKWWSEFVQEHMKWCNAEVNTWRKMFYERQIKE